MDESSRVVPSYYVLFCAICGSIMCFLPLITSELIHAEDLVLSFGMKQAMTDSSYQLCIIASLSAASPILMDIALDYMFLSVEIFRCVKTGLWMLILSSVISSVITLFVAIPYANDAIMACMIPAVSIIVLCSCLCILHAYGSVVWKIKYSLPVLIFYSIGSIVSSHISFAEDAAQRTNLCNTTYTFWGISLFLFVCLSLLWALRIFTILRSKEPLPNDDLCCSRNLVAGIIYWVIDVVLLFYYCNGDVLQAGTTYHIARSYLLSVFVVVITALNARFVRAAMILSSALREAETKRMLVGYFSHEIRTPLNSLLMGLQVVEKEIVNGSPISKLFSVIDDMNSQCDAAVDILNDLLLYERLEEGIIDLNLKPVPIKSFIKKKIQALLPQCTAKQITLDLKFPNTLKFDRAYCRGDEDKLGQVLRTLLSNAIECTPPMGTITVKVNVMGKLASGESSRHIFARTKASLRTMSMQMANNDGHEDHKVNSPRQMVFDSFTSLGSNSKRVPHSIDDNDQVIDAGEWKLQIRIIDSGPGITPEDQRTMFDNAMRFTAGVLQNRQGKSLGLWISHSIVKHHEGCLTVSSDGVQGSTFTIEMPSYFATASGRIQMRSGSTSEYVSKHIRFSLSSSVRPSPNPSPMHRSSVVINNSPKSSSHPITDVLDILRFARRESAVHTRSSLERPDPHGRLNSIKPKGDQQQSLPGQQAESRVNSLIIPATDGKDDDEGCEMTEQVLASDHMVRTCSNDESSAVHRSNGPSLAYISDVVEDISRDVLFSSKAESRDGNHSPRRASNESLDPLSRQNSGSTNGSKLFRRNSVVRAKLRGPSMPSFPEMNIDCVDLSGNRLDESMDEKSDREVQLPMRKDDPQDVVVAQTLPAKMHLPTRSRMVLVVDDAPMNRRMLCRLLEGHCGSTVEADDGAVAVDKLKSSMEDGNPFVLVLMDYQMPKMDGPTAARRMRDMGYTGPIVGVTGNTLPHHIRTFIDGGANYVVHKPLNFDTLKRTLTEIGMGHILDRVGDKKYDEKEDEKAD